MRIDVSMTRSEAVYSVLLYWFTQYVSSAHAVAGVVQGLAIGGSCLRKMNYQQASLI